MALDRVRQAPAETGAHGVLVFAELGDDGLLAFLHDEETGAEPDKHHDRPDQTDADAGAFHVGLKPATAAKTTTFVATAAAARTAEKTAQLAVEIAPQLVQVGWTLVRALAAPTSVVALGRWRRRRRLSLCGRTFGLAAVGRLVVASAPTRIVQVEHAAHVIGHCCPAPPG